MNANLEGLAERAVPSHNANDWAAAKKSVARLKGRWRD